MSGVDTTGLELGSCKGSGREVRVDDGAPSSGDPLQVTWYLKYYEYILVIKTRGIVHCILRDVQLYNILEAV